MSPVKEFICVQVKCGLKWLRMGIMAEFCAAGDRSLGFITTGNSLNQMRIDIMVYVVL
jgi:hypothetical protein